jgi:hypothetical protein
MSKFSIFTEIWLLLRHKRKWWMMPLLLALLMLGTLLVFAQSSALAPFIYTIF